MANVKYLLKLLQSSPDYEKEEVLKLLLHEAVEGNDVSTTFSELGKLLSSEDEEVQHYSILILCEAVEHGATLEPPLLLEQQLRLGRSLFPKEASRLLADCYLHAKRYKKISYFLSPQRPSSVKIGALHSLKAACQRGTDISPLLQHLIPLLSDEKGEVRYQTLLALDEAARNSCDISIAIPSIIPLLDDQQDFLACDIKIRACNTLTSAAVHHRDISAAIPLAKKQMKIFGEVLRLHFAQVIAAHYLSTGKTESLQSFLVHRDSKIRTGACAALVYGTESGIDITFFLPTLIQLLYDGYFRVEIKAYALLLEYAERKRENAQKVQQLLKAQHGSSVTAKELSLQCTKIQKK